MVESRDARDASAACQQSAPSADALYKQGMSYYRRRQWRQAREAFQGLKHVDPSSREIDSLLEELDIFIRLESCTSSHPLQEPSRHGRASASPLLNAEGVTAKARRTWVGPVIAGAVVLMFMLWGLADPRLAGRVDALRSRGEALSASGQWSEAINTYEELVLLAPSDTDVQHALASAYYSRGLQRAADAQGCEERQSYQEAAQQWEMALADFRAACDVVPQGQDVHPPDDPAERISEAQEHKRCATLLQQALQLKAEGRWPEAIEALQSLQTDQPDYRAADVQRNLSQVYLDYGRAAISAADAPAQIQAGIDLIRQARDGEPDDGAMSLALERAQVYLQAATSYDEGQWTAAISTLETLLQDSPDYADGRAQSLLCRAYMQRAGEFFRAGLVQPALADYQFVSAGSCEEQGQAQEKLAQLSLALTPTPLPLPTATSAPLISPSLNLTPTLVSQTAAMQPPSP